MQREDDSLWGQTLERLRQLLLRLPQDASVPELLWYRRESSTCTTRCLDRPVMLLNVQGRKRMQLGTQEFELTPGRVIANCVDMPCASAVVEATPERPYLAVGINLQRKILADIVADMPPVVSPQDLSGRSAWMEEAHLPVLDAFLRLSSLGERPEYAQVLAPLIVRELHFLVLMSPHGNKLRDLYMLGGRDGRIIDVIAWLKQNFAAQTSMEGLARMAHMSVSSFHRHFKAITGYSPLQYHKKLRLLEAQRLMLAENERVSEAAMAVGYESISQFNREYRRMFGDAPRRDVTSKLQKLVKKASP